MKTRGKYLLFLVIPSVMLVSGCGKKTTGLPTPQDQMDFVKNILSIRSDYSKFSNKNDDLWYERERISRAMMNFLCSYNTSAPVQNWMGTVTKSRRDREKGELIVSIGEKISIKSAPNSESISSESEIFKQIPYLEKKIVKLSGRFAELAKCESQPENNGRTRPRLPSVAAHNFPFIFEKIEIVR